MLFQVDCLLPIHLFDLIFYLAPSSATYFSVILFSLTYCIYGLLSAGCRVIVPLAFVVCPLITEVDLGVCVASYWEGLVPALWWVELNLFPLIGRATSYGVFWGVHQLSTTLHSLFTDR